MKKYKFYIYPHIYFSKVNDGNLLLYNTKNNLFIENNSPICCELIDEIYKPDNLGVIDLTDDFLNDSIVMDFINQIVEYDFGKLIDVEPNMPKLINLLPVLNLQDDVDRLKQDQERGIGENALHYLNELNIYLNNQCDLNCPYCNWYYKQTKSCYKDDQNSSFQPNTIKEILDNLTYSSLKRVNFLGGNLFLYPYLNELIELLKEYNFDFHYWIHIENLLNVHPDFDQNKDIMINFPVNIQLVKQYIENHRDDKKSTYHFLIENDSQYNEVESIVKATGINNYQITPIYTGNNLSFFEENIYLAKEDIFTAIIPHRIIFCNQKLNSNHFGKLSILSDGYVKATMNTPTIGNIYTHSILEIIAAELNRNTAWRVIRNEKPCNQCVYQYLCPAPSNYEMVIGKKNLCHVKS